METLQQAVANIAQWDVLLVILCSAVYGIAVGAVPGLTATMAVALIVPLTFFLSDIQAIAAIVTTVTCSIFAGDIPATLVRIPGTPASAAYVNDAYALTRQGRHSTALGVSLIFSVIGGLFGALVLAFFAPMLAGLAAQFTSFEYFWLYVVGLSCAVMVSNASWLRGGIALLLGLLFSTVGLATDFSVPRLTFGVDELVTGVSFIPAMIGLFGISEVLRCVWKLSQEKSADDTIPSLASGRSVLSEVMPIAWRRKWHLLRSSLIGSLVGVLPGAGADIAAWISYAASKRMSKRPAEYGTGSVEGLGDATGANNAAIGGAWIPALVFGIPGDSVTAIAVGVLLMKNVTPGPGIFDAAANPAQAVLVTSIYIAFVLANLILIPVGLLAIRGSGFLLRVPQKILLPLIVIFCIVGSYSLSGSYLDLWVMLTMGVVGFFLERARIPVGPIVLGLILGGELEHRFIQSITTASGPLSFVDRPIALTLAAASALLWIVPLILRKRASVSSGK